MLDRRGSRRRARAAEARRLMAEPRLLQHANC
jgi:hypothetical protein